MTTGNAYKQTTRTQRIIQVEDTYSNGMMYVNTPLDTGFSRVLINYDFAENEKGLKPRPGFKSFARTPISTKYNASLKHDAFCISNSVARLDSARNTTYTDTIVVDKDVYRVGPYTDDITNAEVTRLTHESYTDPDGNEVPAKYFEKDRGHCFAWQGNLYHMHADGLHYFNEQNIHSEVSPRALAPKEAVTTGYNMLHSTPYKFSNVETSANSGDILGVLPYYVNDDGTEGDLAINAPPGRSIYLRVYLAVANNDDIRYQYRVQWRESTQGTWETLSNAVPECDYDLDSTEGIPGSQLYSEGIRVAWELPNTSGLPIYIRVELRVATETKPAYEIHESSNIVLESTLGKETDIPDMSQYGLKIKHLAGAYNTFASTLKCTIPRYTHLHAGSYIGNYQGTVHYSGREYVKKLTFAPSFYYYPETNSWGVGRYELEIYDDSGVLRDVSYLKNCFYSSPTSEEPIKPSESTTIWFKTPAGSMFRTTHDEKNTLISTNTLRGLNILCCYVGYYDKYNKRYEITPHDYPEGTGYADITYNISNLYAETDLETPNEEISYTIGRGTFLKPGTILNDVKVYETTSINTGLPAISDDGYYRLSSLSKIAPVTSVVSFLFKSNNSAAAVVKYDLTTAKGMCFWKDRLVLWGVAPPVQNQAQFYEDSANLLFFSELNDPSYFPYPHNVNTFTEPVLRALPFGDDLLVITASSMHLVTLNPDGVSWTSTQIQTNLRFREDEMYLVQVVNNMVLFKSGAQFYMLVPSTTNIGNLVIAPITKNIKNIFDNPEKFIKHLFAQLFSSSDQKDVLDAIRSPYITWHLETFVDFEHVHIAYTSYFELDRHDNILEKYKIRPTIDFLYNTTTRTWRIYLYSSLPCQMLLRKDAVRSGIYVGVSEESFGSLRFEYRCFDTSDLADAISTGDIFSHRHYLDTGLRNQNNVYKKRYREAQLCISNHTDAPFNFHLEYSLDGVVYKPLYAPVLTYDKIDTDTVTDLDYEYSENMHVTGTPVLVGTICDKIDYDTQGIPLLVGYSHDVSGDVYSFSIAAGTESMLEAPFTIKLRTALLGKGYAPSLKIYDNHVLDYTILGHVWVYRIMNAR